MDHDQLSFPWIKGPNQLVLHPLVGDLNPVRGNYLLSTWENDSKGHNAVGLVHVQAEWYTIYYKLPFLCVI